MPWRRFLPAMIVGQLGFTAATLLFGASIQSFIDPILAFLTRYMWESTAVVAIAADTLGCYTLALSATGEVFSWGGGRAADSGALGQGDKLPRGVPTRVEALSGKGVCGLSACYSTSLAWTVAGRLFTWGQFFNFAPPSPPDEDNPNRVGVNKRDDAIVGQHLSPTLIQELEGKPVRCAAAGHLHIVAVLQNGQLYSWGPSGFSHGHGQTRGNVIVPTQVRKAGNMTAPI